MYESVVDFDHHPQECLYAGGRLSGLSIGPKCQYQFPFRGDDFKTLLTKQCYVVIDKSVNDNNIMNFKEHLV